MEENSENVNSENIEPFKNLVTNMFEKEITKQKFYNFLRMRRKPSKSFNGITSDRESPIGPVKLPKPNKKCPLCDSGKKYKKCCGMGA